MNAWTSPHEAQWAYTRGHGAMAKTLRPGAVFLGVRPVVAALGYREGSPGYHAAKLGAEVALSDYGAVVTDGHGRVVALTPL